MNLPEFFKSNAWWGKILGGFFGYLMAGSIGAVFGVLIGNFFDKGMASHFANANLPYLMEKRKAVQKIFFEATFAVMGHIAKSDGKVSEEEIAVALALMDELHLSRSQKQTAKQMFNEGKQPGFDINSLLHQIKIACRDNRDLLKLFLDIQYRAARVDGLNIQKILSLNKILVGLGFAPLQNQYRFHEDFGFDAFQYRGQGQRQQQSQNYNPKSFLDQSYAILEVPPTATQQEVKRAYRQLMSRNHPDKLTAQGLPPEMMKVATDKTQNIIKAYELICKAKGW